MSSWWPECCTDNVWKFINFSFTRLSQLIHLTVYSEEQGKLLAIHWSRRFIQLNIICFLTVNCVYSELWWWSHNPMMAKVFSHPPDSLWIVCTVNYDHGHISCDGKTIFPTHLFPHHKNLNVSSRKLSGYKKCVYNYYYAFFLKVQTMKKLMFWNFSIKRLSRRTFKWIMICCISICRFSLS